MEPINRNPNRRPQKKTKEKAFFNCLYELLLDCFSEPGTLLLSHVQELLGALGDEVLKLGFLVVFEFSG